MKNILQYILLFISLNFLVACDCMKTATGIVYDAETKLPLVNVQYNGTNNTDGYQTNETGEFKIMKMAGRRCGIIKTVFYKKNYKTLKMTIKNWSENNIIYLVKQKTN